MSLRHLAATAAITAAVVIAAPSPVAGQAHGNGCSSWNITRGRAMSCPVDRSTTHNYARVGVRCDTDNDGYPPVVVWGIEIRMGTTSVSSARCPIQFPIRRSNLYQHR